VNASDSMQPCDVLLMINPDEVAPVTLLLEGSNVGRGDIWYEYHLPVSLCKRHNTYMAPLVATAASVALFVTG